MSAMNILTTPAIDFATFNARSSTPDGEKHNGNLVPVCEHCKKTQHTKEHNWKLHGRPPSGKKRLPNDKQNSGCAYVSEYARTSQPYSSTGNQDPSPPTLGAIAQLGILSSPVLSILMGRIHRF